MQIFCIIVFYITDRRIIKNNKTKFEVYICCIPLIQEISSDPKDPSKFWIQLYLSLGAPVHRNEVLTLLDYIICKYDGWMPLSDINGSLSQFIQWRFMLWDYKRSVLLYPHTEMFDKRKLL